MFWFHFIESKYFIDCTNSIWTGHSGLYVLNPVFAMTTINSNDNKTSFANWKPWQKIDIYNKFTSHTFR